MATIAVMTLPVNAWELRPGDRVVEHGGAIVESVTESDRRFGYITEVVLRGRAGVFYLHHSEQWTVQRPVPGLQPDPGDDDGQDDDGPWHDWVQDDAPASLVPDEDEADRW